MIPAINNKDGYKVDHRSQYPEGTTEVYSNFTPRESRDPRFKAIVNFGMQAFVKRHLLEEFNETFFNVTKEVAVNRYKRRIDGYLGPGAVNYGHIAALHDLGYLPIEVKALPEGTISPVKVPVMTIRNTHPDFFWLPNALETLISCENWLSPTSATTAFEYRKILQTAANQTSDMPDFVQWQGHDFSMRGHTSVQSAIASGAAHLLSFTGTDTIPAIDYLEQYYNANSDKELIGGSVAATEHSVMCLGGQETERDTYERLLTQVYPKGIVSVVSDTWDYWKVLTETVPSLKKEIMARDGKLVIRPDSGDPVKIICGDPDAVVGSPEFKGSIELLWENFGGTVNSKGFKQLDPHVGLIYGDSITLSRCEAILAGLKEKKFASTNVVFGIGSFTYQHVTRDTFGFAMKATHGVINGKNVEVSKAPKTDGGVKKSAKGYLRVNADLTLSEQVTFEESQTGLLETVFKDGVITRDENLETIRKRLLKSLF